LTELRRCLETGGARTIAWDLSRDLGMCCGGRMEFFVEPLEGRPRLLIFGAGHVACATAALALRVGFRVTVIDEREELNADARFAGCERILDEPDEALRTLAPSAADWMLVMTHDHGLDEQALIACLKTPHRYIGMIGSRRKVLRVVARICERHPELDLARLFAPVGLDLGALGPEEIAVSVVAELLALRRGRAAPHMRVITPEPMPASEDESAP
jgi:xanthine dehydrogenase accessory factor